MADTPNRWIELSVAADAESVESVSELLSRYGYNNGVVIEEPYRQDEDGENFEIDPARPVVVRTFLPEDDDLVEKRAAIEQGLWHLQQIGQVGSLAEQVRLEEDWENAWKQHFHVLRIGHHFVIRPTWCEHDPRPGDLVIDLDPGMAFGTGSHPSTEMCLLFMEEIDFEGASVLDAGAGSGILSIGAMLRGARHVDAVEIDPYAAKALEANIELNAMQRDVSVIVGPVGSEVPDDARYDIVIANVIARVLVENAETLVKHVAEGGSLLASGIIEDREQDVLDAFERLGFAPVARRQSTDWVTLRMERKSNG